MGNLAWHFEQNISFAELDANPQLSCQVNIALPLIGSNDSTRRMLQRGINPGFLPSLYVLIIDLFFFAFDLS